MNILITGALGHIGSYYLTHIHRVKTINKIFVIDKINEKILNLINLKVKKKIYFLNQDLSKKKINFPKKTKIDFLIHLASVTDATASIKNKKEVYRNNLNCFNNVLNFCKNRKVKLIHISSTSVYGSQNLYVDENCKELKPQSPYADVKIKRGKNFKEYK